MKTKLTSKIPLEEQYNLPYPEIHQISDHEDGDADKDHFKIFDK